jgi:zinc transport system substrate-binding protein
MRHLLASFLSLFFTLYYNSAFSSNLVVVAITKPIHSLVASVTDGISKPRTFAYTISAHDHVLKPSEASNLELSDVIFYVDDILETSVKTFAKNNIELAELSASVSHFRSITFIFQTNHSYS